MRSIARLGFCSLLACSAAGAIALACDDTLDLPDLPSLDLDSGPLPTVPVVDASIADAAEPDADADAGPPDPLAPFLGIWRGSEIRATGSGRSSSTSMADREVASSA